MKQSVEFIKIWGSNILAWSFNFSHIGDAYGYFKEFLAIVGIAGASGYSAMRAIIYFKDNRHKLGFKKNEMEKVIILDNGHGIDTNGKRSPIWDDGTQLFEWDFNRQIVRKIANHLRASHIPYHVLVPEENDVSLKERCVRANKFSKDSLLISVHGNAFNGQAHGYEVFTSEGLTKSDPISQVFFEEMKDMFPDKKMRTDYSDGYADKEARFTIITKTKMPAVLTENFFFDNEEDCKLMMSEKGQDMIALAHFNAITKCIKKGLY